MRALLVLFLGFAALWRVPSLSAQTPANQQPMLSPGDSVRIVVWQKPEFSGDFVVAPDGSIAHPLFREIKVAGMPLAKAEENVRSYLRTYYKADNPPFVMEPLLRVSVSGNVPRPMVFAAQPQTSISDAIARAGVTDKDGNRRHVRVIRSDPSGLQRIFYVNLEDPADRLSLSPIHSGDQIVVDPKKSFFRDLLLPAIGIIGSVASFGLLIDRIARHN
jgi:polysaccharide export outer membrane protein